MGQLSVRRMNTGFNVLDTLWSFPGESCNPSISPFSFYNMGEAANLIAVAFYFPVTLSSNTVLQVPNWVSVEVNIPSK